MPARGRKAWRDADLIKAYERQKPVFQYFFQEANLSLNFLATFMQVSNNQ